MLQVMTRMVKVSDTMMKQLLEVLSRMVKVRVCYKSRIE